MSQKVTDLEKFALEDIWRGYWPAHPLAADKPASPYQSETYREGLARMGRRGFTLAETVTHLRDHSTWAAMVIGRLARIGVTFPDYIQHPLVDEIRRLLHETENQGGPND